MATTTQLDFVTVDVFTSQPYEGNPLAIVRVPRDSPISQEQKQSIAREFNLSETTFWHDKDTDFKEDKWTVDIFITTAELPFAGHPTIGTACYLLRQIARDRQIEHGVMEASFTLKAGEVALRYDVAREIVTAAIPHDVRIHQKRLTRDEIFAVQPELAQACQQSKVQLEADYPIVSIVKGMTFVLVELEHLSTLSQVSLANGKLAVQGLDSGWESGFIGTYFFVRTGKTDAGAHSIRTRMIEGPLEDPATGSAASDLAAYIAITEGKPNETFDFDMVQGVEMGRRSVISIQLELTADKTVSKLYLQGQAVQVMEGRLTIC